MASICDRKRLIVAVQAQHSNGSGGASLGGGKRVAAGSESNLHKHERVNGGIFIRKLLSLLLVLVLCVAFALPAFAANGDETAEPQACSHTYELTRHSITYQYISNTSCRKTEVYIYTCTKCGYVLRTTGTDTIPHDDTVYDATCNGSVQTWKYDCTNCGSYLYTTYKDCPGMPHTGSCRWLPV